MGKLKDRYIRFDWAIKRLLRDKANFAVLEGLLTVLFEDKTQIVEILESEGNQLAETDKFNRVDIKARTAKAKSYSWRCRTRGRFIIWNAYFTAWPRPSPNTFH